MEILNIRFFLLLSLTFVLLVRQEFVIVTVNMTLRTYCGHKTFVSSVMCNIYIQHDLNHRPLFMRWLLSSQYMERRYVHCCPLGTPGAVE